LRIVTEKGVALIRHIIDDKANIIQFEIERLLTNQELENV